MLKFTLFCAFLTCVITNLYGAPVKDLESLTGEEFLRYFPRTEDIAWDRVSLEQWEALKQMAERNHLSVGEAIAIERLVSRQLQNELAGKPSLDTDTAKAICSDINRTPRGPVAIGRATTELYTEITNLREKCKRLDWN